MKAKNGTYVLLMESHEAFNKKVGRLGLIRVRAGYYIYIGSAFGPGGVKARVRHHMGTSAKPHWHIDYIKKEMRILEIWYTYDHGKREHEWVGIIGDLRGVSIPFHGFGSSDCLCDSHLFYFLDRPLFDNFQHLLNLDAMSYAY